MVIGIGPRPTPEESGFIRILAEFGELRPVAAREAFRALEQAPSALPFFLELSTSMVARGELDTSGGLVCFSKSARTAVAAFSLPASQNRFFSTFKAPAYF